MMTLSFVNGRYHLVLPMNFGSGILPRDNSIDIEVTINCLTPGIEYGSTTHFLTLRERGNLRCKLTATPKQMGGRSPSNKDFHLHYLCRTNAVSSALLKDDASKSFVCFVNPPEPTASGETEKTIISAASSTKTTENISTSKRDNVSSTSCPVSLSN